MRRDQGQKEQQRQRNIQFKWRSWKKNWDEREWMYGGFQSSGQMERVNGSVPNRSANEMAESNPLSVSISRLKPIETALLHPSHFLSCRTLGYPKFSIRTEILLRFIYQWLLSWRMDSIDSPFPYSQSSDYSSWSSRHHWTSELLVRPDYRCLPSNEMVSSGLDRRGCCWTIGEG